MPKKGERAECPERSNARLCDSKSAKVLFCANSYHGAYGAAHLAHRARCDDLDVVAALVREINMASSPGQKIPGSGTLSLRDFWEG